MSCKYAWRNGYVIALERVREFANKQFEEAKELQNSDVDTKPYWWRAQGQKDVVLNLLEEIGNLIGKDE